MCSSVCRDISKVFETAVKQSKNYHSNDIADKLETINKMWCRLEDDSRRNWYLISETDGKTVTDYYGYLCSMFPVALLMNGCPESIAKLLEDNNVFIEKYCEHYYCEESVLKEYVDDVAFIDDSFLYNNDIPLDFELYGKIEKGIKYINQYNFEFEEIK